MRHHLLRYGFAAASIALATWISVQAQAALSHTRLVIYFTTLIMVAWYAGLGPAILALALAILLADIWVVPPQGFFLFSGFGGGAGEAAMLAMLAGVGALIIFVSHRARRGQQLLRQQAAELQDQAIELEYQMESTQSLQIELELANDQLETANRDLERNREFLEQAQRSAHLGSWEWNIDSNRVTWSDELFRVFGLEPGSVPVTFETFIERVHPDDRDRVTRAVQASLRSRTPFQFDHRAVLPDGRVRWVEAHGRVVEDGAGKAVRMIGSGQDVTERRRTAELQRFLAEAGETFASSLNYRTTLATVANLAVREIADWCSIAMGDSSGRYENIAVAHRDPERVKWAEEWSRSHPPRFDAPTGTPNVLRTGKSELYPVIPREMLRASITSEEEKRALEQLGLHSAMIVPMIARGRTLGAITFVSAESRYEFTETDLWLAQRLAGRAALAIDNALLFDEARQARATAEMANQAKMDFLAAMSHEFRTPLNAIAGYAELLELGVYGELSTEQREVLGRLQRSERHMLGLVEEVLGFARLEAGQVEYHVGEVPLVDVVARAHELIQPQMQAKGLKFVWESRDSNLRVRADGDRVQQIVVNLLSNAVKFTPDGGVVTVDYKEDGDSVLISVSDTGIGIPESQHEVVFEPFAQLPHARSKRSSGVGLGLAISRDLARGMGGDITLRSAPGTGSSFEVRLPRA